MEYFPAFGEILRNSWYQRGFSPRLPTLPWSPLISTKDSQEIFFFFLINYFSFSYQETDIFTMCFLPSAYLELGCESWRSNSYIETNQKNCRDWRWYSGGAKLMPANTIPVSEILPLRCEERFLSSLYFWDHFFPFLQLLSAGVQRSSELVETDS